MSGKSRLGLAAGIMSLVAAGTATGAKADGLECADAMRAFNTIAAKKHVLTIGRTPAEARRLITDNPAFIRMFVDNLMSQLDPEHLVFTQDDLRTLLKTTADQFHDLLDGRPDCGLVAVFSAAYESALEQRRSLSPTLESLDPAAINALADTMDAIDERNRDYVKNRYSWAAAPSDIPGRFRLSVAYKLKRLKSQFEGRDIDNAVLLHAAYMHTVRSRENGVINKIEAEDYPSIVLNNLMKSLDPYSSFEAGVKTFKAATSAQTNYVGLGFNNSWVTYDGILLKTIAPDSPIVKADIRPGDLVVSVNGHSLAGLSNEDMGGRLHCQSEGSPMTLGLLRGGQAMTKDMQCASIKREAMEEEPAHRLEILKTPEGRNILYITLLKFTQHSYADLIHDVEEKESVSDIQGYMLNMRGNPGGFNVASLDTAGVFLHSSLKARETVADGTAEGRETEMADLYQDNALTKPLVILTDEESASSSEHTACDLQDYNRGIVISDKAQTYGKGTGFEEFVPATEAGLPADTGFFTLSNMYFFCPSGRSTQLDGVRPDILVGNDPKPRIPLMTDLPNAIPRPLRPAPSIIKTKWIDDSCKRSFIASLKKEDIEQPVANHDTTVSAGLRVLDRWIGSKDQCMFANRDETPRPLSPYRNGPAQ